MTPSSNPLAHPDEDLLTAFAERTLTPAERVEVQSHLADCERCRHVIFLAQQAEQDLRVSPVAEERVSRRQPRLAWVLAGALGCALLAVALPVLVAHRRPPQFSELKGSSAASHGQQVAAIAQPASAYRAEGRDESHVPQSDSRSTHPASPKPERRKAPTVASGEAARVTESQQSLRGAQGRARQSAAALRSLAGGRGNDLGEEGGTAADNVLAMREKPSSTAGMRVSAAPPAVPSRNVLGGVVAGATQSVTVVPSPPADLSAATVSVSAASIANQPLVETKSLAGSAYSSSASLMRIRYVVREGKIERELGGKHLVLPAPGHARVSAVAFLPSKLLAVDSSGALFLSEDGGYRWAFVPKQWSGKAVTVSARQAARSATSGQAEEAPPRLVVSTNDLQAGGAQAPITTSAAQKKAEEPVRAVQSEFGTFELMNDDGKSWVSNDGGRTWRPHD